MRFPVLFLDRCADISNVLKPFNDSAEWAVRITDEFFSQVDFMFPNWFIIVASPILLV